jgi:acyl-coenzyme A thioesterase PaaI-like protein
VDGAPARPVRGPDAGLTGGRVTVRERLAASVRRLIDAVVRLDGPPEALDAAAAAVDALTGSLAPFLPDPPPPRHPRSGDLADPHALMPFDPVVGRASPLAPPIALSREDGRVVGRVRFGTAYEGPPGCVHGGIVAAAFDQVLNVANLLAGTPGPTAKLEVRYRRPTPLDRDLCFEGWRVRVAGRRIESAGRLLCDGEPTAEARGVFVLVPLERVLALLGRDRFTP